MVDREHFDEYLRDRAKAAGAHRYTGTYIRIDRDGDTKEVVYRDKISGNEMRLKTNLIIGADGARSKVGAQEVPGGDKIPYVIAYHEIIEAPAANENYDPMRCDVIYDGNISPDFYGWVFPHGAQCSVGMGTEVDGVDLKEATAKLRESSGLSGCKTIRKEGAPIPLNAAQACLAYLASANVKDLRLARKSFMKEHKMVFRVLRSMQDAYYKSDDRRERFVSLCHDVDVQRLTFEAYMNKKLVKARPMAHIKIGLKNLSHLTGLVRPQHV